MAGIDIVRSPAGREVRGKVTIPERNIIRSEADRNSHLLGLRRRGSRSCVCWLSGW